MNQAGWSTVSEGVTWPDKALRAHVAGTPFDLISVHELDRAVQERPADAPFEYVVTPNVDHVVRNHRMKLTHLYDGAWISACDSRILAKLAPMVDVRFPSVITGSDLTHRVLHEFLRAGDSVTIVGSDPEMIERLRRRFQGITFHHYNPPMGFIQSAVEIERAIRFVLEHPARYVLLAVGSPQQEMLALRIRQSGGKGLGLCIGASILFVTGAERRAPRWMQALSMEWLYRLIQNPRRLFKRYLIDNPAIVLLLIRSRRKA